MNDSKDVGLEGAGRLGMYLLLASLGVLFLASLFGYLYIRFNASVWPPPGSPGLSAGMWLNTGVLLACSFFVHRALGAVRQDDEQGLLRGLVTTFILGVLFLVLQLISYLGMAEQNLVASTNLYGFTFYMLTGLHFAHVMGGLIPLGVTLKHARSQSYSATRHSAVEYVAMYWHFLDAVWVVIFLVLLLGS